MILQEVTPGKLIMLLRNREVIRVVAQHKAYVEVTGANGKHRIEGLYERVDKVRT